MRRARILVLPVLLALLGAAPARAATRVVVAGAPSLTAPEQPGTDVERFFSQTVQIHAGDSVRWLFHDAHTVTFPGADGQVPAFVTPDLARPYQGYSDAAGAPFWFDGFPALALTPAMLARTSGATYDGTQFRNSGTPLFAAGTPYTLRFTRPGVYTYYCLLHPGRHDFRDGMRGVVRVLPAGVPIPGASADHLAVEREWRATLATGRALARAPAHGPVVQAGRARAGTELLGFFPARVHVRAGSTVTFRIAPQSLLFHTVSFGPRAVLGREAARLLQRRGSEVLARPITFLGTEPLQFHLGPPQSYTGAVPVYDGSNHGNGLLSLIGMDIDQATPNPESVQVRFTRPGHYRFFCLVHFPAMSGEVDVTG